MFGMFSKELTRAREDWYLEHNYASGCSPEVRSKREMQSPAEREMPSMVPITITPEGPTLGHSTSGANASSTSGILALMHLKDANGLVLAPTDPAQILILPTKDFSDDRVYHVFDERRRIPIYEEVEREVYDEIRDFRSDAEMHGAWSINQVERMQEGRLDFLDQLRNPLRINPATQSYGGYQPPSPYNQPAMLSLGGYQPQLQLNPATPSDGGNQPVLLLHPAMNSYPGYELQPMTIEEFFPALVNQYLNPSQDAPPAAANNGN